MPPRIVNSSNSYGRRPGNRKGNSMGKIRKRVLSDFPWLEASLISFNGSGYADRTSAQTFMDSYLALKTMHDDHYALTQLDKYWQSGIVVAEHLVGLDEPTARYPSSSSLRKFSKFYPPAGA